MSASLPIWSAQGSCTFISSLLHTTKLYQVWLYGQSKQSEDFCYHQLPSEQHPNSCRTTQSSTRTHLPSAADRTSTSPPPSWFHQCRTQFCRHLSTASLTALQCDWRTQNYAYAKYRSHPLTEAQATCVALSLLVARRVSCRQVFLWKLGNPAHTDSQLSRPGDPHKWSAFAGRSTRQCSRPRCAGSSSSTKCRQRPPVARNVADPALVSTRTSPTRSASLLVDPEFAPTTFWSAHRPVRSACRILKHAAMWKPFWL